MKKEYVRVEHTIPPFYEKDSTILILGSMPSIKSRELAFYYMHPQNRFWKVLARVFDEKLPITVEERKRFLKRHRIALWDCIESCEIIGSSDATIRNVEPTDINRILKCTKIHKIFTTGKKSQQLYDQYLFDQTKIEAINLPSTSSSNIANYSEDQLVEIYKIIKEE